MNENVTVEITKTEAVGPAEPVPVVAPPPAMPAGRIRVMDPTQVSMVDTDSEQVKALMVLGKFAFDMPSAEDLQFQKRAPMIEYTARVMVPMDYLLDFLKGIKKLKDVKVITLNAATELPLLVEVKHKDGAITRYWLAPHFEAES
jgi:hypothetical protein